MSPENSGNAQNLIETLERLRVNYTGSLPMKIVEVEAAAATFGKIACTARDEAALIEIRGLAHKLAGSGATFGFAAMGEAARSLEHLADEALELGTPLCKDRRAALIDTVTELRALAARGADTAIGMPSQTAGEVALQSTVIDADERGTIILVEDDDTLALQLRTELENFGFSVTTLRKPCELKAAMTTSKCTAIVMDVVFGGDDEVGPDTIRQLREEGAHPPPVIFLSGRTDAKARIAAVRAGCDAYLTKPVSVTELVDTLDRHTGPGDTEPYRVLIIDDDPAMAAYSGAVLEGAGMITMPVIEPINALEAIEAFSPELILLDLYMHTCNGTEIALMIRQKRELAGLPIVFLSNETETSSQLDAMRRGGDDFLTKSMQPDHLVTAVALRAARFRALRALMVRDSLTGLLDHSATKQALETEIARAKRNGEPLTFALLDIDHFKSVNDQYGHQVGDWVIKSIARLLKQRLRGVDIIGRMGGEEFAAVLTGANLEAAREILDQIRTAFGEIVHRSGGKVFHVTFSCGLAQYPQFGTATMLTEAADKALYQAKRSGRDRVVASVPPAQTD